MIILILLPAHLILPHRMKPGFFMTDARSFVLRFRARAEMRVSYISLLQM